MSLVSIVAIGLPAAVAIGFLVWVRMRPERRQWLARYQMPILLVALALALAGMVMSRAALPTALSFVTIAFFVLAAILKPRSERLSIACSIAALVVALGYVGMTLARYRILH